MPGLLIKELPDELHQRLKERASANRRSMTNEALVLLERALLTEDALPEPFTGNFELTQEWLEHAKRDGRE